MKKENEFNQNSLFIVAKGNLNEVRLKKSNGSISVLREINVIKAFGNFYLKNS